LTLGLSRCDNSPRPARSLAMRSAPRLALVAALIWLLATPIRLEGA
jgi:hypothetical protein